MNFSIPTLLMLFALLFAIIGLARPNLSHPLYGTAILLIALMFLLGARL